MKKIVGRRGFIKGFLGAGVALPFLTKPPFITKNLMKRKGKMPIIITGRGRNWGQKVLSGGWSAFEKTGDLMDGIIGGANVVELDPADSSVGYGGIPNEDGVVQLDASVMHGPTRNAGAVACLENIKTPSTVARLVMERTDHVMLVGEGALRFALHHGFKKENLLTERARLSWLRWKENLSDRDDWFPPKDGNYDNEVRPTGTINVLGLDEDGNVYGCTTTSGLGFKIPGRAGDSPIIGAGLYVDNDVGACGATGRGEAVMKVCGSFLAVENMRRGMSPKEAVEAVCKRIIDHNDGKVNFNDNFLAINKNGEFYHGSIRGRGPAYAAMTKDGLEVLQGGAVIKS
jgi:N4-(beta-N-acetylglucosaminyl)-L-asparaginase